MPCHTAHLWFDELQADLHIPVLHIVDAALTDLVRLAGPRARVGLLATEATLESQLYIHRSHDASSGLSWLLPRAKDVRELVMPAIRSVKAGEMSSARRLLQRAADELISRGASALLLACTELPLVTQQSGTAVPLIDATAALAQAAVRWSMSEPGTKLSLVRAQDNPNA
jgi:aspartate racemase